MALYDPTGGSAPGPPPGMNYNEWVQWMIQTGQTGAPAAAPEPVEPGLDPLTMAANEYAPQFAALDAAIKAQQNRFNTSNKDLASMYEALASSTLARRPTVEADYAKTGSDIDRAYTGAMDNVTSRFTTSASNIGEMLKRLGIEQAAPDTLGKSQSELVAALSDIAKRSSAGQSLNKQLGQNEISYLGRTADTSRLAGKNAQTDLARQFQALQAQNDQERIKLVAGRQQAANNYSMGLAKMQQDAAQANMNSELKRAQLELDKARYTRDIENDSFTQGIAQQRALYDTRDPNAILSSRAYEMFQGDPQAASNAVLNIINAYQRSGGTSLPMLLEAIDSVPSTNPLERDRYKQLALDFWTRVSE